MTPLEYILRQEIVYCPGKNAIWLLRPLQINRVEGGAYMLCARPKYSDYIVVHLQEQDFILRWIWVCSGAFDMCEKRFVAMCCEGLAS